MSSSTLQKIVRGSDVNIPIRLTKSSGGCFDVTGYLEIEAIFDNDSGGKINLTESGGAITITDATQGELLIEMDQASSAVLLLGTNSFEVVVTDANSDDHISQFIKVFEAVKRL